MMHRGARVPPGGEPPTIEATVGPGGWHMVNESAYPSRFVVNLTAWVLLATMVEGRNVNKVYFMNSSGAMCTTGRAEGRNQLLVWVDKAADLYAVNTVFGIIHAIAGQCPKLGGKALPPGDLGEERQPLLRDFLDNAAYYIDHFQNARADMIVVKRKEPP